MAHSDEKQLPEQRLIALEEWMMHTDHLLKSLNEVVCQLQDRLDEQSRQIEAVKASLRREPGPDEEERSFEDERPPHY
jgi:uncharacterized coiled-coil protein SlyX